MNHSLKAQELFQDMDSYVGRILILLTTFSLAGARGEATSKVLVATTPDPAPYDCPDTGCTIHGSEYDCTDKKFTCIQQWNNPLSKYDIAVKTINYKTNRLTKLPSHVFEQQFSTDRTGLAGITFLDLSFNQLSQIEINAFAGLTSLETLSLVSNHLQHVPTQAFIGLKKLKHLNLRINPIATIAPHAFSPLNNLEKLELNFCHIATISPDAFEGLRRLTYLDLEHNRLDSNSITTYSFAGLPELGTVKLANNKETFRIRDINWMEAFGISAGGQTLLRRSDEDEDDYGDLLEFKTPSSDTGPDYYEVPCKCKRLSSDSPDTTTCPLIWKFFKANMTLECIGKARHPEGVPSSNGLIAKSDQEVEKPWTQSQLDMFGALWFVFIMVVNVVLFILTPFVIPS